MAGWGAGRRPEAPVAEVSVGRWLGVGALGWWGDGGRRVWVDGGGGRGWMSGWLGVGVDEGVGVVEEGCVWVDGSGSGWGVEERLAWGWVKGVGGWGGGGGGRVLEWRKGVCVCGWGSGVCGWVGEGCVCRWVGGMAGGRLNVCDFMLL